MEHRPSAATSNPTPGTRQCGYNKAHPLLLECRQSFHPTTTTATTTTADRANLQLGTDPDRRETSKTDAAAMLATLARLILDTSGSTFAHGDGSHGDTITGSPGRKTPAVCLPRDDLTTAPMTSQAARSASGARRTLTLLTMPPEIRQMIFDMVCDMRISSRDGSWTRAASLVRTCKQIRSETRLYRNVALYNYSSHNRTPWQALEIIGDNISETEKITFDLPCWHDHQSKRVLGYTLEESRMIAERIRQRASNLKEIALVAGTCDKGTFLGASCYAMGQVFDLFAGSKATKLRLAGDVPPLVALRMTFKCVNFGVAHLEYVSRGVEGALRTSMVKATRNPTKDPFEHPLPETGLFHMKRQMLRECLADNCHSDDFSTYFVFVKRADGDGGRVRGRGDANVALIDFLTRWMDADSPIRGLDKHDGPLIRIWLLYGGGS